MNESINIVACGDEQHAVSEVSNGDNTEIVMSSFNVNE
jgi:hypothetical protein